MKQSGRKGNKTGTNLKSPQKKTDENEGKIEAKGLKGKSNEQRLNNERKKENGQNLQQ